VGIAWVGVACEGMLLRVLLSVAVVGGCTGVGGLPVCGSVGVCCLRARGSGGMRAASGCSAHVFRLCRLAAASSAPCPALPRLSRLPPACPPPLLPQDLWGKLMWVWDRPHVQKLRLTISMANFRQGRAAVQGWGSHGSAACLICCCRAAAGG
jgi:hypothetical protein